MLQSLFSAISKSGAVARQLKIVVAAVALGASFSAQADYPIIAHSYSADPAAVEFNGRLYLYGSNDNENGTNGYVMASINCFSTDDLKNWTDHGVVFRATNTSWASLIPILVCDCTILRAWQMGSCPSDFI